MAYPTDKPSGNYKLRDSNFAELDSNKIPMDNGLWKTGYKNAEESEVESVPDAHEQNWLFDVLHRNLKYTQETAEENKRLLETKVASPTNIGQVKIGYGLNITAGGVLSVAKDVAADANIISYDLPVGSYMLWCGKNTPEYFLEPDGSPLLRSSYPELWEFAERNNLVGTLFGSGNGSTTFTITDIRGSFISIADSNEKVGKFTEAGLPNITGNLNMGNNYDLGSGDGAFRVSESGNYSGAANGKGYRKSSFNASRSNPIYGKSNTVTPANWGLKLIIKAKPTPPSNAVPTGTILDYTGNNAPDGYIVANGAELSRDTFSQLYQWAVANGLVKDQSEIPSTAHAYYGTGDGITTFTIPDLRGVQKASSDLASNRDLINLGEFKQYDFATGNIPDYSKGTSVSKSFTAQSDGLLSCTLNINNSSAYFTVNGKNVARYVDGDGVSGAVNMAFSIPLAKGDKCDRGSTGDVKYSYFFPYKSRTQGYGAVATTPILKY